MRSLAVILIAAAATGCGLDPLPGPCAASRLSSGGQCCPPWTRVNSAGACLPRAFSLPAAWETVGPPGARHVDVAVGPNGRAVAAWEVDTMDRSWIVAGEEVAPRVFTTHAPSAALSGNSSDPSVAAGLDGSAILAFRQGDGSHDTVFVSARDPGASFVDPRPLDGFSFPPNGYEPRVAIGASGEQIVVWNQWYDVDYGVAVAHRPGPGAAWSRPATGDDVISPHVLYSNAPRIALNAAGQAIIVWYQSNGGPLMVYKSERSATGAAFSHPGAEETLSAPGAPVDSHAIANPMPAISSSGEAAVVWTQEDGKGNTPVYLATRDAAGKWTQPRDLGDIFGPSVGKARCPQIAFGPAGDLYVIWYQDEGAGDVVYAARRAPDGHWVEPGAAPMRMSSENATAFAPAIAVGPDGEAIAVWSETDHGRTRVAARRTGSTIDAEAVWGPIEILSPDGEDAVEAKVAIGGPGDRAVVGWAQGSLPTARAAFATVE